MKKIFKTFVIVILLLVYTNLFAAMIQYTELVEKVDIELPYGEPIILFGKLSEFRSPEGEKLTVWIAIHQVAVLARLPGEIEIAGTTIVDQKSGTWRAACTPFPKSALVTFEFRLFGRLNKNGIEHVTANLIDNKNLFRLLSNFTVRLKENLKKLRKGC